MAERFPSVYPKIRSAARFHNSMKPSVPAAMIASPADCIKASKSNGRLIIVTYVPSFTAARLSRDEQRES